MKGILLGGVAISALLIAASLSPASAADPGYKAPSPATAAWNWTGFYVGLQGGAGWGTTGLNETSYQLCEAGTSLCDFAPGGQPVVANTAMASYDFNGWHGGGTAGFNWQSGPIVLGLEGDLSAANITGQGDCSNATIGNSAAGGTRSGCQTNMTWFATATGRLGFAVDHALLYVKAGGAWAHFDYSITSSGDNGTLPGPVTTLGENRAGGTAGVGIEYNFWRQWSAKAEYDYMDFGTKNLNFVSAPFSGFQITNTMNVTEHVSMVRAGLNYKFDWNAFP